ncbi:hypothetical protein LBMAG47_05880 [Planctomycetia bacterium]|nr:hypothetical protein LBMAG47_05880 [Planctomycetia bacterium]
MPHTIAIIVEPEFMRLHVGVRNYLFALHALLGRRQRVDWVTFVRGAGGERQWFHLQPQPGPAGDAEETVIAGTPASVLPLVSGAHRRGADAHVDCWRTAIGTDLAAAAYDEIIISNPWLVDFESRLPAPRVLGVVYDLVPNQYVFSMPPGQKPLSFAAQHRRGFVHYRDHCDAILAISPRVADDYAAAFPAATRRVIPLPPLLPAAYASVPAAANDRGRRVVLAGPFDRRKGSDVIPAILNAAGAAIETVSIYGGVRCSSSDLREFFRALQVRHVEWYPHASAATVQRLFLEAKALLFPSYDEGLGLPILEAQYCGCRVLTRDKRPMCDLVGPGAGFVAADDLVSGAMLAGMVEEPFDHVGLQRWAHGSFGERQVLAALSGALPSVADPGQTVTGGGGPGR